MAQYSLPAGCNTPTGRCWIYFSIMAVNAVGTLLYVAAHKLAQTNKNLFDFLAGLTYFTPSPRSTLPKIFLN